MTSQENHEAITAERALPARTASAFQMGRDAAQRGHDYFACPLTDHECRMRWADGFNSTREWWV